MKRLLTFVLSGLLFHVSVAQDKNPLVFLEALMGKTWVIEAQWGDGSVFKQELKIEYGLQDKAVYSYTKGFVNTERTEFGDRSFGVRKYDLESDSVLFWEFDTFGGVTTGEIVSNGKDIWFIYAYQGMTFADIWEYLDEETYAFRVVAYDDGEIGDVYLKGAYKVKN